MPSVYHCSPLKTRFYAWDFLGRTFSERKLHRAIQLPVEQDLITVARQFDLVLEEEIFSGVQREIPSRMKETNDYP